MLQYYNQRPKEEFVEAIKAQHLLSAEDLDSLVSTHGNMMLSFATMSYIPNFNEIEPMERYRERVNSLFGQVDTENKGKVTTAQFCEFLQAIGYSTITTEQAAEMIKVISIYKLVSLLFEARIHSNNHPNNSITYIHSQKSKGYMHFDDCTFLTRADWYQILQGKLRFKDIDYPPW